jgi:hypothetical protein
MFGRMNVVKVLDLGIGCSVDAAVSKLLEIAGTARVVRWLEFPAALLVFLLVPGDPESGAVYVLDRRQGAWFWVDFEDERFGGYSAEDLDCLLQECQFLRLVERPGLLRSNLPWVVRPGCTPEAAV